jgi:hypothetical protein|tara:strand:- start:685 stop:885 length:201 start_codon:yes stop_codon:yes gene_type:complete
MYFKGNSLGLMKKGDYSNKLMGAIKTGARLADDPYVQFGVGVLNPELGAGLALAKKSGLLKSIAGR